MLEKGQPSDHEKRQPVALKLGSSDKTCHTMPSHTISVSSNDWSFFDPIKMPKPAHNSVSFTFQRQLATSDINYRYVYVYVGMNQSITVYRSTTLLYYSLIRHLDKDMVSIINILNRNCGLGNNYKNNIISVDNIYLLVVLISCNTAVTKKFF